MSDFSKRLSARKIRLATFFLLRLCSEILKNIFRDLVILAKLHVVLYIARKSVAALIFAFLASFGACWAFLRYVEISADLEISALGEISHGIFEISTKNKAKRKKSYFLHKFLVQKSQAATTNSPLPYNFLSVEKLGRALFFSQFL